MSYQIDISLQYSSPLLETDFRLVVKHNSSTTRDENRKLKQSFQNLSAFHSQCGDLFRLQSLILAL